MGNLSESNVRAGRIAVGTGMVDQGTVDRAIHLLEARDSQISLGELLLQLGHITPEQFKKLMALHHASTPPVRPGDELAGLLRGQEKIRRQFSGFLEGTGIGRGGGSLKPDLSWELLSVDEKGVLTLGAHYNRSGAGGTTSSRSEEV
jgi:hypothetical protein